MEWASILPKLVYFSAGIAGSLIGGFFSMLSARRAVRQEAAREKRQQEREVQSILDALAVEIDTLWSFHMDRIGAMIEGWKPGAANRMEFYYPLTQDYFTVYHMNANRLGQIRDAGLRKAIVVCYNKCKKVVDGFKYNNELYREYVDALNLPEHTERYGTLVAVRRAKLEEYAVLLREDHFEVKTYVEDMLNRLEDHRAHYEEAQAAADQKRRRGLFRLG